MTEANVSRGSAKTQEVYCICRKPYDGQWMIVCEKCDEWFHGSCISLSEDQGNLAQKFYCEACRAKYRLEPEWKPKCRLPDCWQAAAIDQGSKYCSTDHGVLFFKELSNHVYGASSRDVAYFLKDADTPKELALLANGNDESRNSPAVTLAPEVTEEADMLSSRIAQAEACSRYLALAIVRKKQIGAQGSDICGMDSHLVNDTDFMVAHANDTELPDGDNVCHNEPRKCLRHAYWSTVFGDRLALNIREYQRRIARLQGNATTTA